LYGFSLGISEWSDRADLDWHLQRLFTLSTSCNYILFRLKPIDVRTKFIYDRTVAPVDDKQVRQSKKHRLMRRG
jgi:hypothetical protein